MFFKHWLVLILMCVALIYPFGKPAVAEALNQELRCLALTVYWEARSLSPRGRQSVAHVALNRAISDGFPKSVCQVVYQGGEALHKCQFSWWCDGKSDIPRNGKAWKEAVVSARKVLNGKTTDPTGGALYYHTKNVNPYWADIFTQTAKIDGHIFYR